jgi:hypothetical protein
MSPHFAELFVPDAPPAEISASGASSPHCPVDRRAVTTPPTCAQPQASTRLGGGGRAQAAGRARTGVGSPDEKSPTYAPPTYAPVQPADLVAVGDE